MASTGRNRPYCRETTPRRDNPKDVILLASYYHAAAVLLPSYPGPTSILPSNSVQFGRVIVGLCGFRSPNPGERSGVSAGSETRAELGRAELGKT